MPLSGNISVKSSNGTANGSAGAPLPYSPSRGDANGPAAPTAPIPGLPQAVAPMPAPAPAPAAQSQEPAGETEAQREQWRAEAAARAYQKDRAARQRLEAARALEARVKGEAEALAKREAALKAQEEQRTVWRQNPTELLRAHGFNPEAALQFMLNGQQLTPEQKLAATVDARLAEAERRTQEELNRIRDEEARRELSRQEQSKKAEEEFRAKEAEFAVAEFKQEIADFLEADPGYKIVTRLAGARGVDAIFDAIDEEFRNTGKRITTKQAADKVRGQLIQQAQEVIADQEVAEQLGVALRSGQPAAPGRAPPPRTLTNSLGPASNQGQVQRPETDAEKRARVTAQIEALRRQGRV